MSGSRGCEVCYFSFSFFSPNETFPFLHDGRRSAMGKGLRAEARGRPLCSRWPQGGALICEPQRTAGPVRSKQGLLFVCWGKEGQDLRPQDCLSPGRRKRRRPDSLQLCSHFAPSNVKMRQTATSTVISLHANLCSTTKKIGLVYDHHSLLAWFKSSLEVQQLSLLSD